MSEIWRGKKKRNEKLTLFERVKGLQQASKNWNVNTPNLMKITEPFVYETRFLSSQLKSYPMSNIHINVNDYYWSEIHNTEKWLWRRRLSIVEQDLLLLSPSTEKLTIHRFSQHMLYLQCWRKHIICLFWGGKTSFIAPNEKCYWIRKKYAVYLQLNLITCSYKNFRQYTKGRFGCHFFFSNTWNPIFTIKRTHLLPKENN